MCRLTTKAAAWTISQRTQCPLWSISLTCCDNLKLHPQLVFYFHRSAPHPDGLNPEVPLFQLRRTTIVSILSLDFQPYRMGLPVQAQISTHTPAALSLSFHRRGPELYFRKLAGIQNLGSQHGLLYL